jgi:hypothetical protein
MNTVRNVLKDNQRRLADLRSQIGALKGGPGRSLSGHGGGGAPALIAECRHRIHNLLHTNAILRRKIWGA